MGWELQGRACHIEIELPWHLLFHGRNSLATDIHDLVEHERNGRESDQLSQNAMSNEAHEDACQSLFGLLLLLHILQLLDEFLRFP